MIAIGGTTITKAYLGQTELKNIAIGDELLLSSEPLPYDAEIEWIGSDGVNKPYIDLGVNPTNASRLEVTYSKAGGVVNIAGARTSAGVGQYIISTSSNGKSGASYAGQRYDGLTTDDNIHTVILNGRTYYYDGVAKKNFNAATFTTSCSLLLMGMNNGGTASVAISELRIHAAKYVSNGVEFDLIPVRVGQVGYLYDKVSKTLFGNDGTGDFILGNDVT